MLKSPKWMIVNRVLFNNNQNKVSSLSNESWFYHGEHVYLTLLRFFILKYGFSYALSFESILNFINICSDLSYWLKLILF
jgi:hypothetical protein